MNLQDVVDHRQIADLVSRLGVWLDEKRFDDSRAVLAEDVEVDTPGGRTRGIDAVTEQARRNHAVDATHHVITDVLVDLDGDRATARANLTVTFVPDAADPATHRTHGERYRFDAVRTPDGWRLARVRVAPVWMTG